MIYKHLHLGFAVRRTTERFLNLARAGSIEVAISPPIIAEVERVLRDKFKWPAEHVAQIEPRLAAFTRGLLLRKRSMW